MRIRLTQIALASSIGETVLPGGESYLVVVFNLEVLADRSFEVSPQQLNLVTQDGKVHEPLEAGLDFPVARFYPQTIQPEHGTAATAIFTLPEAADLGYLRYNLPDGQALTLPLVP